MEFHHHFRAPRLFNSISTRIQSLSKYCRKGSTANTLKRYSALIRGCALCLLALVSGNWAHHHSSKAALRDWLKTHPPTIRVWTQSLAQVGLRQVTKEALLHRAARSLPALTDVEGSVWAGGTLDWVVVFPAQNMNELPLIFCSDCKTIPSDWSPWGKGWEAYDPLLHELKKAHLLKASRPSISPRSKVRDPKEIVY